MQITEIEMPHLEKIEARDIPFRDGAWTVLLIEINYCLKT